MKITYPSLIAAVSAVALLATACSGSTSSTAPAEDPTSAALVDAPDTAGTALTIYSGRSEDLVAPVIAQFTADTGIEVEVRYGDTAELAAAIAEEGGNSPADVFFAQDAGGLGALAKAGLLVTLPTETLSKVDARFSSPSATWVGVSGRARTIVHSTDLNAADVPGSVFDLTDPEWAGKVGWAPTNASFQAFVTAMRSQHGDDVTRTWLTDMLANGVQEYPKNTPIVEAVGRGEIELGLVNHYYLHRFLAEDPAFPAANAFLTDDIGGLINVAGAAILATSDQQATAAAFIDYLLSDSAQQYFSDETFEYPLAPGVAANPLLPALSDLSPPDIDLGDLDDLDGTLNLLRDAGALA